MKILLIRPETEGIFSFVRQVEHEPLELEYLYAALIAQGHKVMIFDRHAEHGSLKTKLASFTPDVVCITGYITQEALMKRYAAAIKKINAEIKIVLGGSHVELNYQNFYDSNADYLYHIGGLGPFNALLKYIGEGGKGLPSLPGICYKREGRWVCNPKIICNPSELPNPDRGFFNSHKHRYRYLSYRKLALVKGAYSCPNQCNFCYCTNLNSGKYICRDPRSLVEEIMAVDAENIHIVDDNFLADAQYLQTFNQLLQEKKVHKKYLVYGRADFIAAHPQLMAELAGVGLALVMVGLEAISDNELNSYRKQSTILHNEECVALLSMLGIHCAGLFIVHQDMDRQDFKLLYRWIKKRRHSMTATVSILTPMQGTDAYSRQKPMLLNEDSRQQDLAHCILPTSKMSVRRFYMEYYKLQFCLFWITRKHPLYRDVSLADIFYAVLAGMRKLKRKIAL